MKRVKFEMENFGPWEIDVAPTVYPPREDTRLLCRAISRLRGNASNAIEVGCGSGVISMALSTLGWSVVSYDVNPYAVACSRANIERYGFERNVTVREGGVGEDGWSIPDETKLIVWNLPYLNPPGPDEPLLEPIEEASLTDLEGGGWSEELLKSVKDLDNEDLTVVLLFRTDPISPSNPSDWLMSGWSCRSLEMKRVGDERLEVFALWRTGSGSKEKREELCDSAMDRAIHLPDKGWQRLIVGDQLSGRGRRGSRWESVPGDLLASWKINREPSEISTPGILQIGIGAAISDSLSCELKWPNDLISIRGEKIGGIMIEANSSNPGFRIGIGINSSPRVVNGISCLGWSDTIGDISLEEVFRVVDSRVSGILEGLEMVPDLDQSSLEISGWKALSVSLSRGVVAEIENERVRIIGLDKDGFLCLEVDGREVLVSDAQKIKWNYP
tara:strand:- start:14773 stop:16104 length:1332 start_codon:yes stop_codon:yes gene_type:complete